MTEREVLDEDTVLFAEGKQRRSANLGGPVPPATSPRERDLGETVPFDVDVAGVTHRFTWAPGCSVCRAYSCTPPRPDEPAQPVCPDGPALFQKVNQLIYRAWSAESIELWIAHLVDHWEPRHRPDLEDIREHSLRHVPPDMQFVLQIAREALSAGGHPDYGSDQSVWFGVCAALMTGVARMLRDIDAGIIKPRNAQEEAELPRLRERAERTLARGWPAIDDLSRWP